MVTDIQPSSHVPQEDTLAASATTTLPPHLARPLLASVASVGPEAAQAFVRRFRKLTPTEWMTNNRWLYVQPIATQLHVLLRLSKLELPLISIDSHLVANVVYEYMAHPTVLAQALALGMNDGAENGEGDNTAPHGTNPETPASAPSHDEEDHIFDLPSGIYSLLIERLSDPDVDHDTMKRVVQTILKNLVRLIAGDRPYFSRAHIITLYEKLRGLFLTTTTPTGSVKFAQLVETVAALSKYRQAVATGHPSEYRMKCLQTVHHTLLATTFRTLVCRAHYEDLDVMFHYCRQALRGSLIHWLSQLNETELDAVWVRCPHVVAFCQMQAFKLRSQFHPQSAIALRCTSAMTTDEHQLLQGTGSAIKLLHRLNKDGTPKGLWSQLQVYPVHARRALVERLMDELEAVTEAVAETVAEADAGSSTDTNTVAAETNAPSTPETDCARALFTTHARPIVRMMTVKAPGFQRVVHFYTETMAWTIDKLFDTQSWTDMTRTRLQQWTTRLTPVPLRIVAGCFDSVVARMSRLTNNTPTFNFRTHQCLQICEDKLRCLLRQPLAHVRDTPLIQRMLQCMGELVEMHMHAFQIHRYNQVRHLARCLLLLDYVLSQPESTGSTTGTADECAICYNEVPGTMHTLGCGHAFHPECILQTTQFASHTRYALPYLAKCPYCMTEIQPRLPVFNALHTDPTTPSWRLALHYYVYPV